MIYKLSIRIIQFFVVIYKIFVSPYFGGVCRYKPTCSDYMLDALEKYGPIEGVIIGIKRIIRCNPWASSGYDPSNK